MSTAPVLDTDGARISALLVTFTQAIARLPEIVTHSMMSAARRGDAAGVKIWRSRSEEWRTAVARVRALTSRRHLEPADRAALRSELEAAVAMIAGWKA